MRYIFMLFLLILFSGCGPRYKIQKEYIASNLGTSNMCLSSCQSKKSVCDTSCKIKYDICMNNAQIEAKGLYNNSLKQYEYEKIKYDNDLKQYNEKKQRYDSLKKDLKYDISYFDKKCKEGGSDAYYTCNRYNNAKVQLDKIESNYPTYPRYPSKPQLYDVLKQVQSKCSNDCGCTQNYDICFSQCGGVIKYHKICIENCD